MSTVKDKVVVITGASSGIGEATALLLAERGAKVVLGARGTDRLQALADRIADAGGDVAWARTDVKQREDLSRLVKLACERYGKLDVLISNAGVGPISPLDELRVDDWEDTAAHRITPNMAVYAGTKIAVRAISEGLRQEAGDKLRVTVISPGFTRTNFAESMTNPEVRAQIVASMDKFANRHVVILPSLILKCMIERPTGSTEDGSIPCCRKTGSPHAPQDRRSRSRPILHFDSVQRVR